MLIIICFGWFEYFWVYWNYDDVLKYEYDMRSLNEWCDCMLWLGVLKIVTAMEHECDFRVSIKFGNMMFMKLVHEWKVFELI
jgi:hypothetical protein